MNLWVPSRSLSHDFARKAVARSSPVPVVRTFSRLLLLLPQGLGQQGQEPLLLGLAHRTKEFRPAVSGGNLENLLQGGRSMS